MSGSHMPAATAFMDLSANNAAITAGRDVFSHNTIHVAGIPLKERVIKWSLCSANYKRIHDEAYSSRNVDTGAQFFGSSEYKDWVDGKDTPKCNLECVGKPGAGKTSTASAIIENLLTSAGCSSESWIVLYAYFRHDSQSCQTIPIVFCNFLGQIVAMQPEPPQRIRQLYNECAPHNAIPRLDRVIPILKYEISERNRSYIVVDALDEFSLEDPNASSELVAKLEDLGARLLITSRCPVDFTPDTFSRITIFASNEDLIIYIRGQLASNTRLKKLLKGSLKLEREIIEKICEKCDGMFIIARLLVESISRILKVTQVRDVLKNLPKGLDATYELAMDRIDSQSEEFRKLGRRVIEWVVFAKESLTVAELIHAVSVEPEIETMSEEDLVQEHDMVSACAGLIIISEGYVQFVHFSTQEFFARFADRYFPDAERTITETCLRYLTLSASTIHPELEQWIVTSGSRQHSENTKFIDYLSAFPLARYAANHWGRHAFGIQEKFDHSLVAKVYRFPPSPYFADVYYVGVEPTSKMNPLHYQILLCARFGLAVPSLLGLQDLPSAGGINDDSDIERTYVDLNATRDFWGKRPLHFAAWYGHRAVLNLLIEANADVNVRNNGGMTPLSSAAEKGHSDIVGLLLSSEADPTIVNKDGWAPLTYAAKNGRCEAVRILLGGGADPNITDNKGQSPLTYTAKNGHSEAARILLDGGADPNITDNKDQSPLSYAAQAGRSEAVRILLDGGADPNIANNDGWTPLARAAENRHSEAVRMLLEGGPYQNIADHYDALQRTPLACAAQNGHSEAVRMLLDGGADPNITTTYGLTPLAIAAENGHSDAVRMLLDGRADPNIADKYGRTPFTRAAGNGHYESVKMLLDGGVDPNIADNGVWPPLTYAALNGHYEAVTVLLDGGADPNIADNYGQTPLSCAARNGHSEAVRVLLDSGADPNISDNYGQTPLACPARSGHSEVVRMLLDGGADPDIADHKGKTTLAYAVQNGHSEAVRMLLDGGADPDIADCDGKTPHAIAEEKGYTGIAEMILDHKEARSSKQ